MTFHWSWLLIAGTVLVAICLAQANPVPASHMTSSLVDEVINKHWTLLQSMKRHAVEAGVKDLSQIKIRNRDKIPSQEEIELSSRFAPGAFRPIEEVLPWQSNSETQKRAISQQSAQWGSLRIRADFDPLNNDPLQCISVGQTIGSYTCQASDIVDSALTDVLTNSLLPALIDLLGQLFKVPRNPSSPNLKLDPIYLASFPNCTTTIPLPAALRDGTGIPGTDYYLFITSRPIQSSAGISRTYYTTLASASSCQYGVLSAVSPPVLSRPLVGVLNVNPSSPLIRGATSLTELQFSMVLRTLLHELIHALGFNHQLYSSWMTPGNRLYANTLSMKSDGNVDVYTVITPRVVAWSQRHFKCSSSSGIPLEQYISQNGIPLPFWESRVLNEELMTLDNNEKAPSILSGATLALMEDTGWYQANWTMAEPYRWGMGAGCSFLTGSCATSAWPSDGYNCPSEGTKGCTGSRTSSGTCNLMTWDSPLPEYGRHFGNLFQGGSDLLADFCPLYQPTPQSGVLCSQGGRDPLVYGETFGSSSLCFTIIKNGVQDGACYTWSCFASGLLGMQLPGLGNNAQTCTSIGDELSFIVNGSIVRIICPDPELYCINQTNVKTSPSFTWTGQNEIAIPIPPEPPGPAGPGPLLDVSGRATYWFTNDLGFFIGIIIGIAVLLILLIAFCIWLCIGRKGNKEEKKKVYGLIAEKKITEHQKKEHGEEEMKEKEETVVNADPDEEEEEEGSEGGSGGGSGEDDLVAVDV